MLMIEPLDIGLLEVCRQCSKQFDAFNLTDGRCPICRRDTTRWAAPAGFTLERGPLRPAAAVSGLPEWCADCAAKGRHHRVGESDCR